MLTTSLNFIVDIRGISLENTLNFIVEGAWTIGAKEISPSDGGRITAHGRDLGQRLGHSIGSQRRAAQGRWAGMRRKNPYKFASHVYVGCLSRPQLYQEGNHRTGSLIASGILLQNGRPPFVLTRQNAVAYFNPSSEIKFTDKRTIRGELRLPKYQREFWEFLRRNVNEVYVRRP
jgi:hypothetical protein